MPPGGDIKDYYSAIDFGIPETYLPSSFDFSRSSYLTSPLDLPTQNYLDKIKSDDNSKDGSVDADVVVPNELVFKRGGIFSRDSIPIGTKYGPFSGKWESQPLDRRCAWEVSFIYI